MTTQEVKTMLDSVGIPTAYYQFPETQQGPPFLCFYYESDNDMKADDENYVQINRLIVELYTDNKDFELEKTLEGVLRSAGLVWAKEEAHLDDERMFEVIYGMDVIITEENNG